jgi:pimeloyl-ACP methyl ester carboxylesterase
LIQWTRFTIARDGGSFLQSSDQWLLIHGTPLTPDVWSGVAGPLSELGVVHCPSVAEAPHALDVQGALATQVLSQPGDFHVVGHSFGGQIALDVCIQAPKRVKSLTVLCSRDTPFPAFAAAARNLRNGDPTDVDATLARWFRPDELRKNLPAVRYARSCLASVDPSQWATALEAIATYDRSDSVGNIQIPVTLVAAELDPVSTPEAMASLGQRLPDAQLHVLEGAAHMSPFTDSDRLLQLILSARRP